MGNMEERLRKGFEDIKKTAGVVIWNGQDAQNMTKQELITALDECQKINARNLEQHLQTAKILQNYGGQDPEPDDQASNQDPEPDDQETRLSWP